MNEKFSKKIKKKNPKKISKKKIQKKKFKTISKKKIQKKFKK